MGVGGQRHAPAAFTPRKDPVPIVQEGGCASGPVWIGAENLAPTGIRSPDLPARGEALYRIRYSCPRSLRWEVRILSRCCGRKRRPSTDGDVTNKLANQPTNQQTNQVTPGSRVLRENLRGPQSRRFSYSVQPECSLLYSQEPDSSPAHIFTQKARTHTKCYAAASPHWLLHF